MFSLFKSKPSIPASFDRWEEVEMIAASELLFEGPSIGKVRSLKDWLDEYNRWSDGYKALCKAAGTGDKLAFSDGIDRRLYEHYCALFLQSGQWRAILLQNLTEVSDADHAVHLAELDRHLGDLRRRIVRIEQNSPVGG